MFRTPKTYLSYFKQSHPRSPPKNIVQSGHRSSQHMFQPDFEGWFFKLHVLKRFLDASCKLSPRKKSPLAIFFCGFTSLGWRQPGHLSCPHLWGQVGSRSLRKTGGVREKVSSEQVCWTGIINNLGKTNDANVCKCMVVWRDFHEIVPCLAWEEEKHLLNGSEQWGPSYLYSSFLSLRVFFHVYDYGRKRKYRKHHWTLQSRGLNLYSNRCFGGPQIASFEVPRFLGWRFSLNSLIHHSYQYIYPYIYM